MSSPDKDVSIDILCECIADRFSVLPARHRPSLHFFHFETFVRTIGYAAPTVDTDKRFTGKIYVDGVHGAGFRAFSAADTEPLPDNDTAPFPLRIGSGRTCPRTGSRITREAIPRFKSRREATGGANPYSGSIPGEFLMHEAGTCQRAGLAADTPLHPRSRQNFHPLPSAFRARCR